MTTTSTKTKKGDGLYHLRVVRERRREYGFLPQMRSPQEVFNAFREYFETADREQCVALYLDTKGRCIGYHVVSIGSINASLVHPRELFKVAILRNATGVIVIHNHPSGDPTPSADDRALTQRLVGAGEILGITLVDHVVIGATGYYSFSEEKVL